MIFCYIKTNKLLTASGVKNVKTSHSQNPLNLHRFSPFFLSCLFDIFNYLPPPNFRAEIGAKIVILENLEFPPKFKFLPLL
jgi:hypothetical protein